MFKRVVSAFKAAVTSPEVVKAEKSLAVLIAVRLALALGASAGLVEFIRSLA